MIRFLISTGLTLALLTGCHHASHVRPVTKTIAKKAQKKKSFHQVRINFDYNRMATPASNQMALYVMNLKGKVIKTIYVSDFTGINRGYRYRKDALSSWVKAAQPQKMSDAKIDAISGATPETGKRSFVWNMTDESGRRVVKGRYVIKLEATLYWGSEVIYSGTVNTGKRQTGAIRVHITRSQPHQRDNEEMIKNVKMMKE